MAGNALHALTQQLNRPASMHNILTGSSFAVCDSSGMDYDVVSCCLEWNAEAFGASRLLAQLVTYTDYLTAFVNKVSSILAMPTCDSSQAYHLSGLVLTACMPLQLQRSDWPPLQKMTPDLLLAVSRFAGHQPAARLGLLDEGNATAAFLSDCLTATLGTHGGMRSDAILDSLPPDLLGNILHANTIINIKHPELDISPLIKVVAFRTLLKQEGIRITPKHLHQILDHSEPAAVQAARRGITALAERPIQLSVLSLRDVCDFLVTCCSLHLADFTSSASRSYDAALVNSIHTLSLRYPETARCCACVIRNILTDWMGKDNERDPERKYIALRTMHIGEADVLHSSIRACMSDANRILQTRRERLMAAALVASAAGVSCVEAEAGVVGRATAVAASSTSHMLIQSNVLSHVVLVIHASWQMSSTHATPPHGYLKLEKAMGMPGILSLHEEFVRNPAAHVRVDDIMSLCANIELRISSSNSSSNSNSSRNSSSRNGNDTTAQAITLSAARTVYKRLLGMVGNGPRYDRDVTDLAKCLMRIVQRIEQKCGVCSFAHRLHFQLDSSLNVLNSKSPSLPYWKLWAPKMQQLTRFYPIPGKESFRLVVTRCAELFEGTRLLQSCAHLNCKNLEGVMDAALPTKLCAGCRRARYCSPECQRADWVPGGHRLSCPGNGRFIFPSC